MPASNRCPNLSAPTFSNDVPRVKIQANETNGAHAVGATIWRSRILPAVVVALLCGRGTPAPAAPPVKSLLAGFTTVSDKVWDETAVRKVLHTFAFGGQASDEQIGKWADLPPQIAIVQMLTFKQHNRLLSPADATLPGEKLDQRPNTLRALGDFWSSNDAGNRMPSDRRAEFARSDWGAAFQTWTMAARVRGGNPFRHRVGFWETNFHLAVNHRRGVSNYQLVRYYDDVMSALARGQRYNQVIATSALSAAIARQYGHRYNRYYNGTCYCNEDFAREFHQLGFGVLGSTDMVYHEQTSIKNTAAALTGMDFVSNEAPEAWQAENVVFATAGHVP